MHDWTLDACRDVVDCGLWGCGGCAWGRVDTLCFCGILELYFVCIV